MKALSTLALMRPVTVKVIPKSQLLSITIPSQVVWCSQGHNSETLNKFFEELTQEQRDGIKAISADGAKWIDASISKYIPNAIRCDDPFHVVSWANESLDALRKEAWRDAYSEYTSRKKRKKIEVKAEDIKKSVYTLGKALEQITENQRLLS